ncbi:IS5 family transposase [Dyella sp.]|uniref:IS5 family transposase n=1 Tax=Dyella sp. TaxID=1869338 RepID=UPI002B4935B0|nr:IS5 family transposase [Dyella sp.]HKT28280.1 IS5 family transposase [Dyella sp.]
MRGLDVQQLGMFSYVSVEERVPKDHPIRTLRILVDTILSQLDPLLAARYAPIGRVSIPPERLLRAALLQVLYSVRSERLLMEQLNYNLLFRWFVGLNIDDPVWDHSTFSFNRDRLFDEAIAQAFFANTVLLARVGDLVSDDHFSVDGTLLEAWASHKSFRSKDGSDEDDGDFRGKPRSNDTHASSTDPDARLMRKGQGKEAKLSYQANSLMENRNGLIVGIDVRVATGTAEREGALALVDEHLSRGNTLGADKGYDTQEFVQALRERQIKPHIARHTNGRRSAIDGRTARSKGYAISQQIRKRIEQGFGWVKTIGSLRKLPLVGLARVKGYVAWNFAAYNLVRLGGLGGWWNPSPT